MHVEEFKKELSKEVLSMTYEVGRLQRERQTLEQQIADLFAFFAKQRAEMVCFLFYYILLFSFFDAFCLFVCFVRSVRLFCLFCLFVCL